METSAYRDEPPTSFPGSLSCFEKEPDSSWSRGSQNLGAKNKRGEVVEIMVAMTKVTPSGPERCLPPLYWRAFKCNKQTATATKTPLKK